MKRILFFLSLILMGLPSKGQSTSKEAIKLLDLVKADLKTHTNRKISFTNTIETPAAEPGAKPRVLKEKGTLYIKGDLFKLEYGGNTYLNDGKRTFVIMPEDLEVSIMEAGEESGAITPSGILKMLEEKKFTYSLGRKVTVAGKTVQYINLKPVAASDLEMIEIGVDVQTKQMVAFVERGMNKVVNKFTIDAQDLNFKFAPDFFVFKKSDYPNYYIPKF